MTKEANPFSYNQNFVPKIIFPCPWAIYIYKIVQFLNVFSKTARSIFTRFNMVPSFEGVFSICSNGSAQLNTMTTMLVYGEKLLKLFFSRTKKTLKLNLNIKHWGHVQITTLEGPLAFCSKVNFASLCICVGKNIEK